MFGDFFKKRKYRTVRFGEVHVNWMDETASNYSIIFFENDNGKRKYTVSGNKTKYFYKTKYYPPCETWKHTGLLPKWAKDPLAEKLCR